MMSYLLSEDNPLKKITVKFCDDIANMIEDIDFHNRFEIEEINRWHDYIEGMLSWVSNPTIAWDNTNKYEHNEITNITHIKENGYDITFMMDTSNYCILIIKADLKYEEFGLKNPSFMKESCIIRNHTHKDIEYQNLNYDT